MRHMLDQEWIDLIWEAKALGLSIEEVKAFLSKNQTPTDEDVDRMGSWDKSESV